MKDKKEEYLEIKNINLEHYDNGLIMLLFTEVNGNVKKIGFHYTEARQISEALMRAADKAERP